MSEHPSLPRRVREIPIGHNHGVTMSCPTCHRPLQHERDLRGGVLEYCAACGFTQPLERRPPPAIAPKMPPSRPGERNRDRRAYNREYYLRRRGAA